MAQRQVLACLTVSASLIVAVVYLPVLGAAAVYLDDSQYISQNLLVRNLSWSSVRRFFTECLHPSSVRGYYQPLTMVSLMIDYALGGRLNNLGPFHRTALLLHACNTALLVVLLYSLSGRPWVAASVGLLFGLHPMTVESVAWVSERKTLLAAFFVLWSLIAYVRFARCGGRLCYGGCLAAYLLALLAKPTSVPLPAMLILLDYWPLRRLRWRTFREKLPFLALGALSSCITYVSQARAVGVRLPEGHLVHHVSLLLAHNTVFYLKQIVWPLRLSWYYPRPAPFTLANPTVLGSVIGLCLLIVVLLVSLRWTRSLLVGWLIFFVMLLPTAGIIGVSPVVVANRYIYLPAVGLLLTASAVLARSGRIGNKSALTFRNCLVVTLLLAIAGGEAFLTRRYLGYWRSSVDLHRYLVAFSPDAAKIHSNFGNVLQSEGRLDEAIRHYRRALEIEESFKVHYNIGMALARGGQCAESLSHLRRAVHLHPSYTPALVGLAWLLATHPDAAQRNPQEALSLATRADRLTNSQAAGPLDALAAAWAANGRFDRAVVMAEKACWVACQAHEMRYSREIRERLECYRSGRPYCEDPAKRWQKFLAEYGHSNAPLDGKDN